MGSPRDRIILFPRYTTLAGAGDFTTQPLNVSAYDGGEITVWMGDIVGSGSASAIFEESTDQSAWSTCGGTSSSPLAQQTEAMFEPEFRKAWMRLRIRQTVGAGDAPLATYYAVGYVEKRHQ